MSKMPINPGRSGKYSGSAGRNYSSSRASMARHPSGKGGGGGFNPPPNKGCGGKKTIVPLALVVAAPPLAFVAGLLGLGPDLI